MLFLTYPPAEQLKKWVRFYWSLESDEPYTHFGMASVCPEMVFHYKGRFNETDAHGNVFSSFTAGLQAQSRNTKTFITDTAFGIFGVYFFPHTIPMLFGFSASDLSDRMEDLETLSGRQGIVLEERIALANDHAQRVHILDEYFSAELNSCKSVSLPVFDAIHELISNNGMMSVKELAGNYYLSERQLERQFFQYAGFSPKLFTRILRFHNTMGYYGAKEKSLTDIALECGYYDQSHFIHDFKSFSGQHPRHYFSGKSPATSWRD
ncbi:helix-turn-helix domain-containing protein [Pollutibacter soli]|uniref:helix-turn-helix domain-containing protein n=1 Tax=Pollutibacter soli TaxID=3034157 RepID=UPI003013EDD4